MKSTFALPVAASLAVHAFLLFGFKSATPTAIPIVKPVTAHWLQMPMQTPDPVDVTDETVSKEPVKPDQGDNSSPERPEVPSTPFEPVVNPGPNSIVQTVSPSNPGIPNSLTESGPYSTASLDKIPQVLSDVAPMYPRQASTAGLSGQVMVEFTVDETGHVLEAHAVSSSDPVFEESAVRAVGHWVFEPGRSHGVIVPFRMRVPVVFNIDSN